MANRKILAAAVLCALLLAGCGKEKVSINGTKYPVDTVELDLSGTQQPELTQIARLQELQTLDLRNTGITGEDYQALQAALPACRILWSVPFQDGCLDSTSQSVTVDTLTETDVQALEYLTELRYVDADGCRDYDLLLELQQRHPDCRVEYTVAIQGGAYPTDTTELTLSSLSREEMDLIAGHLPQVKTITLTGIQKNPSELLDMMEGNPGITFHWDTEFYGVTVNSYAEFLDFSGILIEDLETLESIVSRLPALKQVDMCNCGISNEEMDALNRRHESIRFVWSIWFGKVELRTDITYLMPYQYDLWFWDSATEPLRYFTELECLDLGHHGITHCDFVAYMPKLKYLLLGDTNISDLTPLEGLENLIYLEVFLTYVTDYTPLLTLKNLESLNLSYTKGQADVIAQMTWLDYVRWISASGRNPTLGEQEHIREMLPDALLEFANEKLSATGGMWRQHQNYFDMRDLLGMPYMIG